MSETTADTALEKVEKAAAQYAHASLYAPSVLAEAAALLTDLWATGERHGVSAESWTWTTSLPDAALSVTAHKYRQTPTPERTGQQISAMQRVLVQALADLGITARPGYPVEVERQSATPRFGLGGTADLAVGLWANRGWDLGIARSSRSPVVDIVAAVTGAGAAEVAAIVQAIITGQAPNPFSRGENR